MDTDFAKKIEDNLEDIPEEVSDFIFGEELQAVVDEIGTLLKGNIEQKERIYNDVTFFLIGAIPMDQVVSYIDSLPVENDVKDKIKIIIKEKVIDELQVMVENPTDAVVNKGSTESTTVAPSPADILARMNQTMVKPTTLPSTKRTYGDPSTGPTRSPQESSGGHSTIMLVQPTEIAPVAPIASVSTPSLTPIPKPPVPAQTVRSESFATQIPLSTIQQTPVPPIETMPQPPTPTPVQPSTPIPLENIPVPPSMIARNTASIDPYRETPGK